VLHPRRRQAACASPGSPRVESLVSHYVRSGIRTVVLNALFLSPARSGGPETYLRGLVPALAREFPAIPFVVATSQSGARALQVDGWGDFAEIQALPVDGQRSRLLFAEQRLLPRFASRRKTDLVHSTRIKNY
jgi:hypothetical protein